MIRCVRLILDRLFRASGPILPLLFAASAFAQDAVDAPPPPSLRNTAAPWIGYLLIFVLFGIVVAISLIPSKRSHQD